MPGTKYLFFLFFFFVTTATGCSLLDRQSPPNIETTPPYWQPQSQLKELRTYHDKESTKMSQMSNEIHIVRNREMERLEAAGKELEKEQQHQQEDYEKTVERREKWAGWFKKKNKGEAPLTSSRTDTAKSRR